MRSHSVPSFALGTLLVTLAGCDEVPMPVAPTLPPAAPRPAATLAPPPYQDAAFPAAPAGSSVYGRISASSFAGHQRYVLLPDGSFRLQYLLVGGRFFEYTGTYSGTGPVLQLLFDDNRYSWVAEATLDGDLLVVKYNLIMGLDDFENGTYARVR